ncbi:unnamed protein product [Withania somnifera]
MEGSESEKVFDSLNLNPQLFIELEVAKFLKTEATDRAEDLKKGVANIKNIIQLALDKRLSMWEKHSLHHCFTVPQGFSLPNADGPSGDSSSGISGIENPELDSKVGFLKKQAFSELGALEKQSTLSGSSAASLSEAFELYQQLSVNDQFEELVQTSSDFHTKVETLTIRMMEDTQHPRAKKSQHFKCATIEELQELVDDTKTLRD